MDIQVSVSGLYFPPLAKISCTESAPNDHFSAGPNRCMAGSRRRCIVSGSSCPTICYRIVSASGVKPIATIESTPDDHFISGPHCRVTVSCQRARWWC